LDELHNGLLCCQEIDLADSPGLLDYGAAGYSWYMASKLPTGHPTLKTRVAKLCAGSAKLATPLQPSDIRSTAELEQLPEQVSRLAMCLLVSVDTDLPATNANKNKKKKTQATGILQADNNTARTNECTPNNWR
jgi:hypothetical protein